MSQIEYACTFIQKTAQEDHYEGGCDPDTLVCTMSEGCDLTAPSLPELIRKLNDHFCLDIDDVFLPIDSDEDEVTYFGYTRLEDVACNEPTPAQLKDWQKGRINLYLCHFTFSIEKRVVSHITAKEFVEAGIKTH